MPTWAGHPNQAQQQQRHASLYSHLLEIRRLCWRRQRNHPTKKKTEACYFTHIGKPITPAMVVCPVLYTGKYLDTSHESKMEKTFSSWRAINILSMLNWTFPVHSIYLLEIPGIFYNGNHFKCLFKETIQQRTWRTWQCIVTIQYDISKFSCAPEHIQCH